MRRLLVLLPNVRALLLAPALLLSLGAGPCDPDTLRVMTYNILHGQACALGGLPSEVLPRMELAVQGGPGGEPGLVELDPDILGTQEVSQVFRDEASADNPACTFFGVIPVVGGIPVDQLEAYEHQGDYLARRLNGVRAARDVETGFATSRFPLAASPFAMRFVRDNPRILPLVPDVALPPDEQAASDLVADLANFEIGMSVFSRFRIQRVTVQNLPQGTIPAETRALLHASIVDDRTGRSYDFFDSHLTIGGGSVPTTVSQAANIVAFIQANRRHPEHPGFFVCDCNATPGTAAYLEFSLAGFQDSFAVANPGADGFTGGRGSLSFDCDQSTGSRIDYVWVLPDDQGRFPAVRSSEVVMDYKEEIAPGVCRYPSDHNGVLSTFDMGELL